MASHPNIAHVTSFAEIRQRLENNPGRADKIWHERTKNSYRPGQPCDRCGGSEWAIGRKTAECGNPRCGNVLLLEKTI
jgi:hypothetical protein